MSNTLGNGQSVNAVGSNIAANTGAVMYEDEKPGSSLSGGAAPTTGQSIHTTTGGLGSSAPPASGYGSSVQSGSGLGSTAQPASGLGSSAEPAGGLGSPAYPVGGLSSSVQPASGLGSSAQPGSGGSALHASAPPVTDVGLSSGGQSLAEKVKEVNSGAGVGTSGSTGAGTTNTGPVAPTGTVYEQASRGAQVAANKIQELSEPVQPYIQKAQETVAPYVQTAQETVAPYIQTAVDKTAPIVQQAKEVATPYVERASELASQGIQATAAELDKRGVNIDSTQKKLAEVGQNLKDYGAVGQARAGEYLQQAVDQVQTIGADGENKNIFATIFGTVALIWLAFGFSLTALLALGVAGTIAAVLSRYSRATMGQTNKTSNITGVKAAGSRNPGVETHYPNPSHPDNSLNN